jgi:hypothetical protein
MCSNIEGIGITWTHRDSMVFIDEDRDTIAPGGRVGAT